MKRVSRVTISFCICIYGGFLFSHALRGHLSHSWVYFLIGVIGWSGMTWCFCQFCDMISWVELIEKRKEYTEIRLNRLNQTIIILEGVSRRIPKEMQPTLN